MAARHVLTTLSRASGIPPRRPCDGCITLTVVATLRDRVDRRDRELFVGRGRELARFDALLAGDPVRLLYVSGAGWIGKSTLLRAMGRCAADAGYAVITLDGRDLQPFPSVLNEALAPAMIDDRTIVVIDSYEMISSLDGWLREVVIPDLRDVHDRRVRVTATSVTRLVRGRLGRGVRIDGPRRAVGGRPPPARSGERRTGAGSRLAGAAGQRFTAGGDGRSPRRSRRSGRRSRRPSARRRGRLRSLPDVERGRHRPRDHRGADRSGAAGDRWSRGVQMVGGPVVQRATGRWHRPAHPRRRRRAGGVART